MNDPRVSTTYLGQYTDEHAETIAAALEEAGITWWHKRGGRFVRTLFAGDWGVRIFVDETKLDEAKAIAKKVTG
jgi:hypothetical protein